jgi:hypothetical protein
MMVECGGGGCKVADNVTDTDNVTVTEFDTVHVGGWSSGAVSQKVDAGRGFGMTSLSDDFNELAVRAKKTEGVIEARVVRDREWLRARLDTLESAMDGQAVGAGEQMVSARVDVETEWGVLQVSLESHFAAVRAKG